MSADRLREAARVLRERAEAATPGPWRAYASESEHLGGDVADVTTLGCSCDYSCNRTDPFYIAMMHPGVGLALADWLDGAASNAEFMQAVIDTGRADNPDASLARTKADDVADLILGGAS